MKSALALIFLLTSWTVSAAEERVYGSTEYSFLASHGKLDDKTPAMALRLGTSNNILFPFNSSFEVGFIGENRRAYSRLSLAALGKQPQIGRERPMLWAADGYVRAELLSMIWAEGGFVGYSPAIEAGISFRLTDAWGIAPAVRFTSVAGKIFERDDTMITVVISLIEVVPL